MKKKKYTPPAVVTVTDSRGSRGLMIYIDRALHERLRERAQAEGRTMSNLCRRLLEEVLSDRRPTP